MPLAAPQNFSWEAYVPRPNSEHAVKLTWDAVAGAVSYKVHKNDDTNVIDDPTSLEDIFSVTVTEYYDTDLQGGMDVFYYVTAVDSAGVEGTPSTTIAQMHPTLERLMERVEVQIGDDFDSDALSLSPFQKKICIDQALTMFNSEPMFTSWGYANFDRRFINLLVLGGAGFCLKRQVILERALEMSVNDAGIGWTPPGMSDMMKQVADQYLTEFKDAVKKVKRNMRPSPIGLGSMQAIFAAPSVLKFRHLRAGRVI